MNEIERELKRAIIDFTSKKDEVIFQEILNLFKEGVLEFTELPAQMLYRPHGTGEIREEASTFTLFGACKIKYRGDVLIQELQEKIKQLEAVIKGE